MLFRAVPQGRQEKIPQSSALGPSCGEQEATTMSLGDQEPEALHDS